MTKRNEKRIEGRNIMYRIMKSYYGKKIHVVAHHRAFGRPEFLIDTIGAYEIEGFEVADFPATGSLRYTLNEVFEDYSRRA